MAATASAQLVTRYTAWGWTLDLDRLLARARPKGRHSSWRRGDMEFGSPAITSGISLIVARGPSSRAHCRTIERFLNREVSFLNAVRRVLGPRDRSELSTTMHVEYPPAEGVQMTKLTVPPALLRLAARRGVEWNMAVWQEARKEPS